MMIHFWENTFWAKTLLSFVFRGPNSAHPEVFRCANCNGTSFKALWWSVSPENTFWAKTSLSFIFRGPNSAHPEVFRCANCNGTSFKAVWWSISEKTHFGLKHHFPSNLEGQTQHTLKFCQLQLVHSFKAVWWSIYEKTHFRPKTLQFRGPNSPHPEVFIVPIAMVQVSKLYDDLFLRKHILG